MRLQPDAQAVSRGTAAPVPRPAHSAARTGARAAPRAGRPPADEPPAGRRRRARRGPAAPVTRARAPAAGEGDPGRVPGVHGARARRGAGRHRRGQQRVPGRAARRHRPPGRRRAPAAGPLLLGAGALAAGRGRGRARAPPAPGARLAWLPAWRCAAMREGGQGGSGSWARSQQRSDGRRGALRTSAPHVAGVAARSSVEPLRCGGRHG